MFDKQEKLVEFFEKHGIECKWTNHDKYGFSRHLIFTAKDAVCEIEWYTNYSTIILDGVAHYWFDKIDDSNTYPCEGDWLEFKLGNEEHGLHVRVK